MDSEKNTRGEVLIVTNCSKRKSRRGGPAKEVYRGPIRNLFRLSEKLGASCYVVSAKYGLLSCEEHIEPYDVYLGDLGSSELEELRKVITNKCRELTGPWRLAIINLTSKYSEVFQCAIEAEYALVIGKFHNIRAKRLMRRVIPKTIGQRSSILKRLGGAESLEDVLRLIEEGT